jgi:hypothetical protein
MRTGLRAGRLYYDAPDGVQVIPAAYVLPSLQHDRTYEDWPVRFLGVGRVEVAPSGLRTPAFGGAIA